MNRTESIRLLGAYLKEEPIKVKVTQKDIQRELKSKSEEGRERGTEEWEDIRE